MIWLADATGVRGPSTPFPQALLKALQARAPEGHLVQLSLWHGEALVLRRVLEQTADGILAELEPPPAESAEERPTVVAAVPWTSIAAARTVKAPVRRGRPGFLPEV